MYMYLAYASLQRMQHHMKLMGKVCCSGVLSAQFALCGYAPDSVTITTWCCSVPCLSSQVCLARGLRLGCSLLSDSGFAAAYYSSQTSPTDEASIFCPGGFCTSVCPLRMPIQSSPRPKETFPVLFQTLLLLAPCMGVVCPCWRPDVHVKSSLCVRVRACARACVRMAENVQSRQLEWLGQDSCSENA